MWIIARNLIAKKKNNEKIAELDLWIITYDDRVQAQ